MAVVPTNRTIETAKRLRDDEAAKPVHQPGEVGMPIRLVLVDDHPIVLQGLQQLFERHHDFKVMCCCPDGASALDAVGKYRPDVLVMDLRMPRKSGLDVLRTLAANQSGCRSVLLTAIVRDNEVRRP